MWGGCGEKGEEGGWISPWFCAVWLGRRRSKGRLTLGGFYYKKGWAWIVWAWGLDQAGRWIGWGFGFGLRY